MAEGGANGHVNRTAGKLRLPVRSGLRPPPVGYLERSGHRERMLRGQALMFLAVVAPVTMAGDLNALYARDYEGFWKQWEQSLASAASCTSAQDTSIFLSNALETLGNSEVTEANARVIENLTISDAECVLGGLEYQQPRERTRVVSVFLNRPLFRSSAEIEGALKQVWGRGRHLELKRVYEEGNRDR